MTATDPTLAGLLAGVLATPDDDVPRLIFADRLDDLGDHERAEFVRLQVELASMPELIVVEQSCTEAEWAAIRPHHPKYTFELTGRKNRVGVMRFRAMNPALDALRRRERELLSRHQGTWFAQAIGRLVYPANLDYEFRRGFVESVTCDLATFVGVMCRRCSGGSQPGYVMPSAVWDKCPSCSGTGRTPGIAPRLFASQPVTKVTLTDRKPLQHDATEWRWLFVGNGEARHQSFIPSELAAHLEYTGAGPTFARYPTRAAALDALSVACVAYGRANAEGHTYESMCDRCQWGAGHYIPAANCTYCRGSNKVRRHGLPPLAGTTRGMTT